MPSVNPGESKKDYISRCIPMVIHEGSKPDQAAAICHSKWEQHMKNKANEWLGDTDHDNTESES